METTQNANHVSPVDVEHLAKFLAKLTESAFLAGGIAALTVLNKELQKGANAQNGDLNPALHADQEIMETSTDEERRTISKLLRHNTSLKAAVNNLIDDCSRLRNEKETVVQELAAVNKYNENLNVLVESMKEDLHRLNNDNEKLKADVVVKKEEIGKKSRLVEQFKKEIDDYITAFDNLDDERKQLKLRVVKSSETVEEEKRKNYELLDEVIELLNDNRNKHEQIDQQQRKLDEQKEENETLARWATELETRLRKFCELSEEMDTLATAISLNETSLQTASSSMPPVLIAQDSLPSTPPTIASFASSSSSVRVVQHLPLSSIQDTNPQPSSSGASAPKRKRTSIAPRGEIPKRARLF